MVSSEYVVPTLLMTCALEDRTPYSHGTGKYYYIIAERIAQ
jgi:hypothetical protein